MLPKVAVLSMGGTIAMTSDKGKRGAALSLDAGMLVQAVPQLADIAQIEAQAFRSLASPDITFDDIEALAREITRRVETGVRGVVVTQGTDTMEETAFLLDRMVQCEAPVVLTGAMRNPSLPGADGPANLLHAVSVAVDEAARGIGTLVVMNDEIHAARYVQKAHATNPAAFRSTPAGPVGWLAEGTPRIVTRPYARLAVDLPERPVDARVARISVGLGEDGRMVDLALDAGYAGLVVDATGGGHVPKAMVDALSRAVAAVPVVFASRTGRGETMRTTYDFPGSEMDLIDRGLIGAGWLDGIKARLLLTLLLRAGKDRAAIREAFDAWLAPPREV